MAIQVQKYMTVTEFDKWVHLPENIDTEYEFIGGEIYPVVSNSDASEIAANILIAIGYFVKQHKLGRVKGADGGYKIAGERYIPDVSFISFEKQPKPSREGYIDSPPDLVVEVVSDPNNKRERRKLRIKLSNFLASGTVVWIIDPDDQVIEVHRPRQTVLEFGRGTILDGGDVLSGFSMSVDELFADLDETDETEE